MYWSTLAVYEYCKAMLETKIVPDFIVVDGSEGGTGAALLSLVTISEHHYVKAYVLFITHL